MFLLCTGIAARSAAARRGLFCHPGPGIQGILLLQPGHSSSFEPGTAAIWALQEQALSKTANPNNHILAPPTQRLPTYLTNFSA